LRAVLASLGPLGCKLECGDVPPDRDLGSRNARALPRRALSPVRTFARKPRSRARPGTSLSRRSRPQGNGDRRR